MTGIKCKQRLSWRAWVWGACRVGVMCLLLGHATVSRAQEAVPFYTVPQWMNSLDEHVWLHRAQAFEQASQGLQQTLSKGCTASRRQALRSSWTQALHAWEALSAVSVGPLIVRRSARRIDFQPTRVPMIERAIAAEPQRVLDLALVGAPAKGLPALEWLLWQAPQEAAACRYAQVLSEELNDEARHLSAAFMQRAQSGVWEAEVPSEAQSREVLQRMVEFVNQWIGGLEALRWQYLGKPLDSAGGRTPQWPRARSAQTARVWAVRWAALRDVVRAAPPGSRMRWPEPAMPMRASLPLSVYLQGRGHLALSGRLERAVAQADADMTRLQHQQPATVRSAVKSLGALRQLMETDVATALQVSVGFSDADGD